MSKNITKFTNDVIKQLEYYVYRLVDPRTGHTFYVGKGKGNRVFAHVQEALDNYEGENYLVRDENGDVVEDDISLKIKQIREIHAAGLEVIHIIHRYGLKDEKVALEVEAALIDCYPGLSNIQAGYASDRGVTNASGLQNDLCLETFADQENLKYCVIKVRSTTVSEKGSVYEAVRGSWRVSFDRISKCPYILAAVNGVVKGVYQVEPDGWKPVGDGSNRYDFTGTEAPENIQKLFLNKRLPERYTKRGASNPVQYHD